MKRIRTEVFATNACSYILLDVSAHTTASQLLYNTLHICLTKEHIVNLRKSLEFITVVNMLKLKI